MSAAPPPQRPDPPSQAPWSVGAALSGAQIELDMTALFEDAPVAILREDWSGVAQELGLLKAGGVTDLDAHIAANPDFIADVRRRHAFVDANAQTVRLFEASDKGTLLGQLSALLPAAASSNIQVLRAMFYGAGSAEGERTFRTRSGELRVVMWRTRIPDTPAGLSRMLFYAVDITDQKHAQEGILNAQAELAHAGRVLTVGELTASIAHEINQPLAAINTFASAAVRWLTNPVPRPQNALADLERIGINARLAADLVSQIRNFIRKAPAPKRAHDPGALIDDALALVRWQAQRSHILARTRIAPGLPAVMADGVQIQQVLVNLMINAIQAMGADPARRHELLVEARAGDDGVVFEVRDTGPGVAEVDAERIFEPFFSSREAGMGMGLAISRTILRAHDSKLTLTVAEPSGAAFAFTLKAANAPTPV